MRRWQVFLVAALAALLTVGVVQPAVAGSDLLEVGAAAEGVEGSTRTWAYRTFLVVVLIIGFAALTTQHIGVFMAAMAVVFLAAFVAVGPDAISDAVGLAEGATLERVERVPAPTPGPDVRSPRLVDHLTPEE
jgi:hypothetical protein